MELPIINEANKLPPLVIRRIKKSLQWIPALDLVGIEYILLTDFEPEDILDYSKEERELYGKKPVIAYYSRKTRSNPAFIALVIPKLFLPIPYFFNFSPVPTIFICQKIAHEVAHHLVRTRGFIFEPGEKYPDYNEKPKFEEEMANRYAFEITDKMKSKIIYKFGNTIKNFLCDAHYGIAAAEWANKNYKGSADYWFKAFLVNPDRNDCFQRFIQSKQQLKK